MNSWLLSKKSQFLLLVSLFVFLSCLVRADPPYSKCSTGANFTLDSIFHANLNTLLISLVSNASTLNFTQLSIGSGKDRVYGNFLCYSTVSPTTCQNSVSTAADDIKRVCPMNMEAIVWEENCQLRYSNKSFFGVMDYTTDIPLWNKLNHSNPDGFRLVVRGLLDNLSLAAAFSPSSNSYALGQLNITKIETVYGLVQCTRDLSGNDCNTCLQNAISHIRSCCYFYRGARVYSRSCFLRYELYPLVEAAAPPGSPPTKMPGKTEPRKLSIAIIIIIAAAVIVAALLCSWVNYCVWGKGTHKDRIEFSTPEDPLNDGLYRMSFSHHNMQQRDELNPKDLPLISLAMIHEVTNHFSDLNILGQGGFGPVYKGMLPDGKAIAVKRLSVVSEQGSEEFMNEILLIMKLQHKNLVKLLGCCIEKQEQILVYEYMPNKSLDAFIFDPKKRVQLDWGKRLNIVTGIARGILYLHQDSRLRIIHRDLKASNVLLDDNLNAKISDFGMARIFGGNLGEANTNIIVGTYGYMAPEYAMEGLYSIKSDVFSFGVLLIEIVTGKRNTGFHLSRRAPSLLAYAWKLWNEGNELELIDPLITESCLTIEFLRCIHIGLLCVQEDPKERPDMSSVIVMLGKEYVPLRQPQRPAFSVGRLIIQCDQPTYCSTNMLTISSVSPR